MSVMLMTTAISGITAPLSAAARAAGAATIFYTIIDAPKLDKSGAKHPEVSASADVVLDHVNFAYPSRPGLKVLDELCLRFPAGKVTAIVGPSGSGKSTIVGLLERWYEIESPDSGHKVYAHAPVSNPIILSQLTSNFNTKEPILAQRLHHYRWPAPKRN